MSRWIDLPIDEIVLRYEAGETALALASVYGVCDVTIGRRLHGLGVKMRRGWRRRGGPLHTDGGGYLTSIDRNGAQCRIHRACWEAYNGPIPKGYAVHHIDEDRRQNIIENLSCMTSGEHTRLHKGIAILEDDDE